VLELPRASLQLSPQKTQTHAVTVPWSDAQLWQPEAPHLYWLCSQLTQDDEVIDTQAERFGFREVWIEGPDFLLNGYPVHFFSDWGHKVNQLHHTEAWNRCWFAMMKAENLNHSRLHTHTHPKLILDLADEAGIMLTGETAIHGSGGEQAADEDAYWEAAQAHIRAFVHRDKNHPSLLLWSVENEMRWNRDETEKTKTKLPPLYDLFRELDPTREAYHEGDSSLWDEQEQAIMSRHYGKECGGYGWWDKARPLHAGEMSTYHYMGPNTNFHTGNGDELWASYQSIMEAAARETLWIVEAGRSQGTAAFGPWNISCLCNLRTTNEVVELTYDDDETPGVKPRFIQPHTSEFAFWQNETPAYQPFGKTNALQAHAFRPFAVIDLSHRRRYFGGQTARRTVYLVNDTASDQHGSLEVSLQEGDTTLFSTTFPAQVGRGRVVTQAVEIALPATDARRSVSFRLQYKTDTGTALDMLEQTWKIEPTVPVVKANHPIEILLVGKGPSQAWLTTMGFTYTAQADLDGPIPSTYDLVVLERNTVVPGSLQNQWVQDFLKTGGHVLLLEQRHSLFPGVELEAKPQIHGFARAYAHPLLAEIEADELQFWGEDPYASMASDAQVAHRVYPKGAECLLQPLVDSGEGGFGCKLPEWTVLGEVKLGTGRLLASQFRFTEKAGTIPEAGRIFAAALSYLLNAPTAAQTPPFAQAEADDPAALATALATAAQGGNAFIRLRAPENLANLTAHLELTLQTEPKPIYHAVRKEDAAVLSGISHVDTSGLDGMSYCFNEENKAVADLALLPVLGLEPLMVTPTRAFLEEQHVHGQRVEALRAHAASRFLFAEAPQEAVMLGRITHGSGFLYVDTFRRAEDGHPRLARYESMLRRNLGGQVPRHALDGETVPPANEASQGFPRQVMLQSLADPASKEAIIAGSQLPAERMAPTTLFRLGGWAVAENAEGQWTAPAGETVAIFTCFRSPRMRKIVMEDSGIPNPESLTFLDVTAQAASVEMVLNGSSLGEKTLPEGRATFSDVELMEGFNQLVLFVHRPQADTPLYFAFRDIMQNPESDLFFLEADAEVRNWIQAEF